MNGRYDGGKVNGWRGTGGGEISFTRAAAEDESDHLSYIRKKKKRPIERERRGGSDDQTHCSVDQEGPMRHLRWHNDECFGLARSTIATGRNAGAAADGAAAASGVEWSLKGRFAPLPASPQARMDEAQKLSSQLRALMDNTSADPTTGGALRVKLQSLLVLLQKDASQAVEDHRLNDYTILSGVADEVHSLLDAHELFVRTKHDEDWESDEDDEPASSWDLRSRTNTTGDSIRHALLRRKESAEFRKATVQDRLVTECRRQPGGSGSAGAAYERGQSFEHFDSRTQAEHYGENVASTMVRGAATPSNRGRGLERNESSSASADELLRLKQRIADLETILHVQQEQLRDTEEVEHIRRMWIHDSARAQRLAEQVRELESDLSRRDQMILTLQETLRRWSGPAEPPVPPTAPQPATPEPENQGTPPRHLLFSDAGAIFEEKGAIEIGCKIRSDKSRVAMRLFLGNLSAGALDGLDVQFTAPRALLVIHEDFPLTILPTKQVGQNVSFICRSFFVSAPMVTVSFLMPHCQSRSITVALPISITRFCKPAVLSLKDYKQLSNNIKFTLNEVSGIFTAVCKFSRIKDKLLATGTFEYIPADTESTKLLFATEAYLEAEPAHLALIGLQLSRGNKVRLVIQSGNSTLSEGLFYGVKAHLS